MKKICVYIILALSLGFMLSGGVGAAFDGRDILPNSGEISTVSTTSFDQSTSLLDRVLVFIKDSIFGILGLVAIGMFLYVGFNLIKAQGNPEEMKKAFMTLIHVIVGLFIVALSWALIKMVSGLIL